MRRALRRCRHRPSQPAPSKVIGHRAQRLRSASRRRGWHRPSPAWQRRLCRFGEDDQAPGQRRRRAHLQLHGNLDWRRCRRNQRKRQNRNDRPHPRPLRRKLASGCAAELLDQASEFHVSRCSGIDRKRSIFHLQESRFRLRRQPDRGRSSAGRASQWHCEGQGFDPPRLHQSSRNQRLRLSSQARPPALRRGCGCRCRSNSVPRFRAASSVAVVRERPRFAGQARPARCSR